MKKIVIQLLITIMSVYSIRRLLSKDYRIQQSFKRYMSKSSLLSLDSFGLTSKNTFINYLTPEKVDDNDNDNDNDKYKDDIMPAESIIVAEGIKKSQFIPRQVRESHYTFVLPESVPEPYYVCSSSSAAEMIGLDPIELKSTNFNLAFSGNKLLNGLDKPYCTVYGCHCYGSWFGQLGDGRAMALGEVCGTNIKGEKQRYELQLKGCGRSPYSRGFDGRAVLRSSIREFIVSEAMYFLNVSTTRALSVIGTSMKIRRPWYSEKSNDQINKDTRRRSPDVILFEPGAVLCRISPSFIRFSQIELFAVRKEYKQMIEIVNFSIYREYPEIFNINKNLEEDEDILKELINETPHPSIIVRFMREVAKSTAYLVADWLRVGYIQGNMNSDNTLIGGRTLDYGPFGWMELYDPYYQPFTSDNDGKFAFISQPTAMNVNNQVLGVYMSDLIKYICSQANIESNPYLDEIKSITTTEFQKYFFTAYDDVRRKKLGFKVFSENDYTFWGQLEVLLAKSKIDFTIFFRQLSSAADCSDGADALLELQNAFYTKEEIGKTEIDVKEWVKWLDSYIQRIKTDNMDPEIRKNLQNMANPKFVPRNWMLMLAYEKAEKNDYKLLEEIQDLLRSPYDEQSDELTEKYYRRTPPWAIDLAGSTFMS